MPRVNSKSPVGSTLATYAGIVALVAPLLLSLYDARMPLWIPIVVGAAVGTPLLLIGIRLRPDSARDGSDRNSFLPAHDDQLKIGWGVLAFATLMILAAAPALLLLPLLLIPSGDGWSLVGARLSLIVLFVLVGRWWWAEPSTRILQRLFRGRISDEYLKVLEGEPPAEPIGVMTAFRQNWQLGVVAATAFLVVAGIIDLKSPWMDVDVGPKRYRRIALVLEWCRGNPNTVSSSSFLIGIGSLVLYASRIWRAWREEAKRNILNSRG